MSLRVKARNDTLLSIAHIRSYEGTLQKATVICKNCEGPPVAINQVPLGYLV